MKFCPKCKSLMVPKKVKGKSIYSCGCGYTDEDAKFDTISEEVKEEREVEVIDEEVETRPIMEATCPKCENDKAWYHLVQTRASDEPETKFLQCTKCKHKWRDYS